MTEREKRKRNEREKKEKARDLLISHRSDGASFGNARLSGEEVRVVPLRRTLGLLEAS